MIENYIDLPNGRRLAGKEFITDLLPKRAAEDVFQLWIWDLGKKLFVSADHDDQFGKSGAVPITDSWELKPIKFQVELGENPSVHLSFEHKKFQQTQTVHLDMVPITYGVKSYFLCPRCSRRVAIIYLRHHRRQFTCFRCSHLFYRSTRLNPKTRIGGMMRRMYAIGKLELKQKRLNRRYLYDGKPTKRCVSWFKTYAKVASKYDPQFQISDG